MRKICVSMLIAALAAIPVGDALAGKKAQQQVEGSISLPQPYTAGCIYRTHRSLAGTVGEPANGLVGFTIEIDPKTANKNFKLDVADGAGMDISFYSDYGDPTDPTTAPANMSFETAGPGGESGKVPEGFPIAFVCMTEGTNASFTYTAGKGVK